MKQWTLSELASALGGEFDGEGTLPVERVVHPMDAQSEHELALVLDPEILTKLAHKPIRTALVPDGLSVSGIANQIRVKRPKVALAKLLDIFERPVFVPPGVHPSAVVDPTAQLGEHVSIGPLCVVGPRTVVGAGTRLVSHVSLGADVTVGEGCLFHPGVRVGDAVIIGNRVILHPNASIGNDGFSFVTEEAGSVETAKATGEVKSQNTAIFRINSIGTVILGDDVEIGANSCVDRATLGATTIQRGTKIDNLVQVGHNVTIGQNCLIAGQVGISGSITVGNRVVMGGQVGIKDHVTIGDDAILVAKAGVVGDVPEKTILIGYHGQPRKQFLQQEMKLKRLMKLDEKLLAVQHKMEAFEALLEQHQPQEAQPV